MQLKYVLVDDFFCKLNIWNVNYAQATAVIFDSRTNILVKVSKDLRQRMSRPDEASVFNSKTK